MWLRLFGVEPVAAQGPSIQSVALAATKSGATGADIVELASLGNFGRQPQHTAEQITLKYCKTSSYHLPSPYIADVPVLVKSNVDCNVSVQLKPIALFLPHDWLAWMGGPALDEDAQELVAGFGHAHGFWSDHDMSDPKLINNPLSKVDLTHCLPMAVHGDGGAFQRHDSITVISMRSLLSSAKCGTQQSQSTAPTRMVVMTRTPCPTFGQF